MKLLLLALAATARAVELAPVEARLSAPPVLAAPALSASLAGAAAPLAAAPLPLSLSAPALFAAPAAAPAAFSPSAVAAAAAPTSAAAADDASPTRRDAAAAPARAAANRIAETVAAWTPDPEERGAEEFDGERAPEYAYAERAAREARAVQYAHQERETLDYYRAGYDAESARELADAVVEFPGGAARTGRELLQALVTADASRTDASPDLSRMDPETLGRSDAHLRAYAEREDLSYHVLTAFYHAAFRRGLIYRLQDSANRHTYYGVPQFVRAALGLAAEAAPAARALAAPAAPSALAAALPDLARAAESLPAKDELFEFAAQTVAAAVRDGLIREDAVPAAFRARADELDLDSSSLKDALLTLLESAHGTAWQARARTLCETAAADGLLPRAELDAALDGLR